MAKDKITIKVIMLRDTWFKNPPASYHFGVQKMHESVIQNVREQINASAIIIEMQPKVVRTENIQKLLLKSFEKSYTVASHYFCRH